MCWNSMRSTKYNVYTEKYWKFMYISGKSCVSLLVLQFILFFTNLVCSSEKSGVKNAIEEGFWSSWNFVSRNTGLTFSLHSKRQSSARAGNSGFTQKILRQVHVHKDLLARFCSWWHMQMAMVKVISGEKRRKERGRDRKGKLHQWPAGESSV